MKLPYFSRLTPYINHLTQLKSKIISFVLCYKRVIFISAVISFSLVMLGNWAIRVRGNFIASIKTGGKNVSGISYISPTPDVSLSDLKDLISSNLGVLSASDSAVDIYPTSAPVHIIAYTPITYAPIPTTPPLPALVPYIYPTSAPAPTSVPDCGGTPTAYNSEAIVSSSTSIVNNPVTIEIQLLDCHNNFTPVSDNLTVSLSNSDGTARINGKNSPVSIQAQNGKATFTVNSQINITDTFMITDTTRSFNVTDPHNRNPSITFSQNSSGNSHCTTASGVPNFWYSDVNPVSPQSSTVGTSFSFNINIRDCNKNTVSSDESLNITLGSGDSSVTVNGHGLPYSLTAHSGQVDIAVNSQNPGTATLIIYDSSSSFNVTDTNNHNPSVNFTSSSSPTSTPQPTSVQTETTPTSTQAPTEASNPTSTTVPTSATTPNPMTTITPSPHPPLS